MWKMRGKTVCFCGQPANIAIFSVDLLQAVRKTWLVQIIINMSMAAI